MDLRVFRHADWSAALDWGAGPRPCKVGSGGIGEKKAEGGAITPAGIFPVRRILYRADRVERPTALLPLAAIAPDDGWCDAPLDPNYNRPVTLPYAASAEHLWRADGLYDLLAVIGFNDEPVVPGRGSAIFLHVAGMGPTQGCVALALADLRAALAQLRPGDKIAIR
jgi:L,D-peptidoglycan transpeptidase YkuD (ErfK/YbiS/YcfS/YnhG family)